MKNIHLFCTLTLILIISSCQFNTQSSQLPSIDDLIPTFETKDGIYTNLECFGQCDQIDLAKGIIKNLKINIDFNQVFPSVVLNKIGDSKGENHTKEIYELTPNVSSTPTSFQQFYIDNGDKSIVSNPNFQFIDLTMKDFHEFTSKINDLLSNNIDEVFILNQWIRVNNQNIIRLNVNKNKITFEMIEEVKYNLDISLNSTTISYYLENGKEIIEVKTYSEQNDFSGKSHYFKKVGNDYIEAYHQSFINIENQYRNLSTDFYHIHFKDHYGNFDFLHIKEKQLDDVSLIQTVNKFTGDEKSIIQIEFSPNPLNSTVTYYEDGIDIFKVFNMEKFNDLEPQQRLIINLVKLNNWKSIGLTNEPYEQNGTTYDNYKANKLIINDNLILTNDELVFELSMIPFQVTETFNIHLHKIINSSSYKKFLQETDITQDHLDFSLKYHTKLSLVEKTNQLYLFDVMGEPFFKGDMYENNLMNILETITNNLSHKRYNDIKNFHSNVTTISKNTVPTDHILGIDLPFEDDYLIIKSFYIDNNKLNYSILYRHQLISGPFDENGYYIENKAIQLKPILDADQKQIPFKNVLIRPEGINEFGEPTNDKGVVYTLEGKVLGLNENGCFLIDDEGYVLDKNNNKIQIKPRYYPLEDGEYSIALMSDDFLMQPIILDSMTLINGNPINLRAEGTINSLSDYFYTYGESQLFLVILFNYNPLHNTYEGISRTPFEVYFDTHDIVLEENKNGKVSIFTQDSDLIIRFGQVE